MSDPGFLGLVRQNIHSVWSLELLLLMRGHPDRLWGPDDLVRELRASSSVIDEALARLRDSDLVAAESGGFRFAPATPELTRFCDQLADAYRTRPVTLINLIASPSRVQGLADAFKFKGDPK